MLCFVANKFTSKFHESSFDGFSICEAFKKAIECVENHLKDEEKKEAEIFKMFTNHDVGHCKAFLFDKNEEKKGTLKCLNNHSLLKSPIRPDWATDDIHRTKPEEK